MINNIDKSHQEILQATLKSNPSLSYRSVKNNNLVFNILLLIGLCLLFRIHLDSVQSGLILLILWIYIYKTILYNQDKYNEQSINIIIKMRLKNIDLSNIQQKLMDNNNKNNQHAKWSRYIVAIICTGIIIFILSYSGINEIFKNLPSNPEFIKQVIENMSKQKEDQKDNEEMKSQENKMDMLKVIQDKTQEISNKITTYIPIISMVIAALCLLMVTFMIFHPTFYATLKNDINVSLVQGLKRLGKYYVIMVFAIVILIHITHIIVLILNYGINVQKILGVFDKSLETIINPICEKFCVGLVYAMVCIWFIVYLDNNHNDLLSIVKQSYISKSSIYNISYIVQLLQFMTILCLLILVLKIDIGSYIKHENNTIKINYTKHDNNTKKDSDIDINYNHMFYILLTVYLFLTIMNYIA